MIGRAVASRLPSDNAGQLGSEIAALPGGERLHDCGQTGACTSACPVSALDPRFNPRRWIHLIQQGLEPELSRDADVAGLCLACGKCSDACPRAAEPQGIVAALNGWLELEGHVSKTPVSVLDEVFTGEVIEHGRVDQRTVLARLANSPEPRQASPVEAALLQRASRRIEARRGVGSMLAGLLKTPDVRGWESARIALAEIVRAPKLPQARASGEASGHMRVNAAFAAPLSAGSAPTAPEGKLGDRSRSVGYFPGCAAEDGNAPGDKAVRAVARKLGLKLTEVEDWNCCGGTHVGKVAPGAATYLAARVLSQAVAKGRTSVVVASCAACVRNLQKADRTLAGDEAARTTVERISQSAGHAAYVAGQAEPTHALEWIAAASEAAEIRSRAKNRLAGLKVACFTGCLSPLSAARPRPMDLLLSAAGATCVEFTARTACCGGARPGTGGEIVHRLALDILQSADAAGAEVLATACPSCQESVELHQLHAAERQGEPGWSRVHVMHFAQLVGLALGASRRELGLGGCTAGLRGMLDAKGL